MNRMLSCLALGAMIPLFAAENLPVEPFGKWQLPRTWKSAEETLEYPFKGWSSIAGKLNLPENGVYRFRFSYRSPGAVKDPLKIRIGKQLMAAYPSTETWSVGTLYFHGEKGICPIGFQAEGKAPYTLQLKQPKLELLKEADTQKIRLDAADGTAPFRMMKGESFQTVEAADHIDGGMAFRPRGKDGKNIRSIELPVRPDQKYRLSFWVKGTPGTFRAFVDGGWMPNVKHWSFGQTKRVSEKWTRQTLEFVYPGESKYPHHKRRLLSIGFSVPAGQSELILKDPELECLR